MEFFREFIDITFEICIAVFIIIFGYAIWNSFNFFDYQAAIKGDTTKEVEVMMDNNILYLHNIAKTNNNINLLFKIQINDINQTNDFILEFEDKEYNLKVIDYSSDNNFNYYNIDNINFDKYETKDFNFKIVKDNKNYINYEFIVI